jgi:hypothetical protein
MPGQAAGVILDPVLRTGPQDQPATLTADSQAVSRLQAQLTQQMGGQGYLVLAAYGTHGSIFLAAGKIDSRRP